MADSGFLDHALRILAGAVVLGAVSFQLLAAYAPIAIRTDQQDLSFD